MNKYGEIPQLRLILQPVTVVNGKANLPDFSAHVVYSFVFPPTEGTKTPQPDRHTFKAIVNDLLAIKRDLKTHGTTTTSKLTVHSGLVGNSAIMLAAVRSLIQKYLDRAHLSGVAFMGVESADPSFFVA